MCIACPVSVIKIILVLSFVHLTSTHKTNIHKILMGTGLILLQSEGDSQC
jgi:hypothetical protein